jgi:hypothetical protein
MLFLLPLLTSVFPSLSAAATVVSAAAALEAAIKAASLPK